MTFLNALEKLEEASRRANQWLGFQSQSIHNFQIMMGLILETNQ